MIRIAYETGFIMWLTLVGVRVWSVRGVHSEPPHQKYTMKIPTLAIAAIIPCLAFVSSCRQKGPAEKAGEKMDDAIEDVKDAVNPKGPVEKAGEKVDEALGK